MILEGALLAAALRIKGPDNLPRNFKNITQVRGLAELDESETGFYKITIHTAEGDKVGQEIIPISILPKKLLLKPGSVRNFSTKFSVPENYEGRIYFCISKKDDPGKKVGGLKIKTRSCYKREILAK